MAQVVSVLHSNNFSNSNNEDKDPSLLILLTPRPDKSALLTFRSPSFVCSLILFWLQAVRSMLNILEAPALVSLEALCRTQGKSLAMHHAFSLFLSRTKNQDFVTR